MSDVLYVYGKEIKDLLVGMGCMPEKHDLKIFRDYFEDVANGVKRFEVRRDDRGFFVGDFVILREWSLDIEKYTGRYCVAEITCITEFGQKDGFVVFGINVKYVFWG